MDLLNSAATAAEVIKDSDAAGFGADVLEESAKVPVVVDFWAPWCGPCKQLTPALEKAAIAAGGKVKLVKINVDDNQQLAGQLQVQSVPAVFAFKDGQPVDAFVGAQPESQIKAFFEKLTKGAGASPIDKALEQAGAMLEGDDPNGASALFSQVLGADPENAAAYAGLIRCCIAAQELDKGAEIAEGLTDKLRASADVTSALAALELATLGGGNVAELRQRVEQTPDDHQARFDLAMALTGHDQNDAAVEQLLEIVRRDREWNDDGARKQLIKLFDAFGAMDPVSVAGRRKLSTLLFS